MGVVKQKAKTFCLRASRPLLKSLVSKCSIRFIDCETVKVVAAWTDVGLHSSLANANRALTTRVRMLLIFLENSIRLHSLRLPPTPHGDPIAEVAGNPVLSFQPDRH